MPYPTPHSVKAIELVGDARRRLREELQAHGTLTGDERLILDELDAGLIEEHWTDQGRKEAIYALNVSLPEAPSYHHKRLRREIDQREKALLNSGRDGERARP